MTTKQTKTKTTIPTQTPETLELALFEFMKKEITVPRNGISETKDGAKFSYAENEDIKKTVNPALFECGLMISSIVEDNHLLIELIHPATSKKRVSKMDLGIVSSSHEMGARITLYTRYGISALLNLVLDKAIDSTIIPPEAKTTKIPEVPKVKEINQEEKSIGYKNAYNAIQATTSQEVFEKLIEQIKRSTKVTDQEKEELIILAQNRDYEINGTIY